MVNDWDIGEKSFYAFFRNLSVVLQLKYMANSSSIWQYNLTSDNVIFKQSN